MVAGRCAALAGLSRDQFGCPRVTVCYVYIGMVSRRHGGSEGREEVYATSIKCQKTHCVLLTLDGNAVTLSKRGQNDLLESIIALCPAFIQSFIIFYVTDI